MIGKIHDWNRFEQPMKQEPNEMVFPYIYGDFTNWKPKKMFEIREFCDRINQYKPEIFELCKQNDIIDQTAQKIEDLNEDELLKYQNEVKIYYDTYRITWKDIIQDQMQYKKPHIVNANFKAMIENRDVPLFVYPCFM